jgi:maltose O-acetyltransferase
MLHEEQPAKSSPLNARRRLSQGLAREFGNVEPRLLLATALLRVLPAYTMPTLRAFILRRIGGLNIGPHSYFMGSVRITGNRRKKGGLKIGASCGFNDDCLFELNGEIVIEDLTVMGHEVMLLTATHAIGSAAAGRCGPLFIQPIHVGRGVWIGTRAIICPGVTIGDGAVVAPGAVVTRDVPPNTLVGGVPAKVLRQLD